MAKYHVKKDGTPGVCHAQEGNCPSGDSSQHFSSKVEAQDYADKINEQISDDVLERKNKREPWKRKYKNYFTLEERLKFRNYLKTGDKSYITEKDINRLRDLMHNGDEIISNLEYTEEEYLNEPKELLDPEIEKFEAWKKIVKENIIDGARAEDSIGEYLRSESGKAVMGIPGYNLKYRELDKIVDLPENTNDVHYINDKDLHKLKVLIGDEPEKTNLFGKLKNLIPNNNMKTIKESNEKSFNSSNSQFQSDNIINKWINED